MADEKEVKEAVEVKRSRNDVFEKRLEDISEEEATLISRMKRRSLKWKRTAWNLIILSVILEFVAIGYAIMTTRTVNLDWRMRSLRVLPMFLLPALSFSLLSWTRFRKSTNFGDEVSEKSQIVVNHHDPAALGGQYGGWFARIYAMLDGDDPTQSYALICGSCHMHNGLARKEVFPFITYYCPHCHALNKPKNSGISSDSRNGDVKLIEEIKELVGGEIAPGDVTSDVADPVEESED